MRKILVLTLIMMSISLLCGCGNDDDNDSQTEVILETVNDTVLVEETQTTEETETEEIVEYVDGYKVSTYDNLYQSKVKQNLYVKGTIQETSSFGMYIEDSNGDSWYISGVGARDLSSYEGTVCEAFGGCFGGISNQHDAPLLNMTEDEDHIVFSDGKVLYPQSYDSCQQFPSFTATKNTGGQGMVWIPTNGGSKYHCKSNCSQMQSPKEVTESEAIAAGYSKCNRCW